MSHLADLSAVELVSSYKAKALSPVEVTEAVIGRIEAYEPKLNALWAYDPEAARLAAKASEARWAKGEPAGPIDGVPLTIKENIATKGTPVPLGCAALPLKPAAADAPPAARTREAGGVLLAKTTMPDLGMLSSGLSSFHKLARNPWDIATNPGGSSAGAGSAAAAGYGPLHIGTDIGGSVRLPAGWCGLVGLKPSFGRIPIDPPFLGRVAGPMTRTVADNALYMSVLSRPDRRDGMSLPYQDIDWMNLDIEVKGLKIGLWLDAGFDEPVGGGNPCRRGSRSQTVCRCRRDHRAGGAIPQSHHDRWSGSFLARAFLVGYQKDDAGKSGKDIALYLPVDGNGRRAFWRGSLSWFCPDGRHAQCGACRIEGLRLHHFANRADADLSGGMGLSDQ